MGYKWAVQNKGKHLRCKYNVYGVSIKSLPSSVLVFLQSEGIKFALLKQGFVVLKI